MPVLRNKTYGIFPHRLKNAERPAEKRQAGDSCARFDDQILIAVLGCFDFKEVLVIGEVLLEDLDVFSTSCDGDVTVLRLRRHQQQII